MVGVKVEDSQLYDFCLQISYMQNGVVIYSVLPTEQWFLNFMSHRHFCKSDECFGHLMQKNAHVHYIYRYVFIYYIYVYILGNFGNGVHTNLGNARYAFFLEDGCRGPE